MSLRNTSFENWRLSRIEEELERLSHSSQDTSADDGSCSPRSAEGTLERCAYTRSLAKDEGIYSRAALCATPPGGSTLKDDENSKDALRFIKEKYDSLGKVKVKKPSLPTEVEQRPLEDFDVAASLPVSNAVSEVVSEGEVEAKRSLSDAGASRLSPAIEEGLRSSLVVEGSRSSSSIKESRLSVQGEGPARSSASISEQELMQVEMFYRSHKTSVFVCLCQATLYLSDPIRNSLCPPKVPDFEEDAIRTSSSSFENWTLVKTGIPVLVLDSGESHRQRRLNLILAERGTGFGLWRDQIDCLSNYSAPTLTFHTMLLSNDHTKLIGLRFVDPVAAADFHQHIRCLTLDASDPLLSLASTSGDDRKAKKAKAGSKRQAKAKGPAVRKADISQPCCFTHITKLDRNDGSNLLRGQSAATLTDFNPRNSPRPGSGSGDRHKVKLKP